MHSRVDDASKLNTRSRNSMKNSGLREQDDDDDDEDLEQRKDEREEEEGGADEEGCDGERIHNKIGEDRARAAEGNARSMLAIKGVVTFSVRVRTIR